MEAAITAGINTYHELNPSIVEELDEEPSPMEFMRYVAKNRPFVVRSSATDWPALIKWNADYLRVAMEGERVNVATTPSGYVSLYAACRITTNGY